MKYGSVCSGIEAATAAWHPLGWQPAFFSEIDKSACHVLRHHYPDVPLHGDFTTIGERDYDPIQLLVGGTPCQDFSIAGLRAGITGDRGNLTLEFLRLAERKKPKWLLWENVPGVLSSDRGRAFSAFLGGLAELGYGFAYRVLDAQYFGVPQRRRRVFVVGYLGNWRAAAAVLFERENLRRDITPRREKGKRITCNPQGIAGNVSSKLAKGTGGPAGDEHYNLVVTPPLAFKIRGGCEGGGKGYLGLEEQAFTLSTTHDQNLLAPIPINTQLGLRGNTSNSSREGVGIGQAGDPMFTLQAAHHHAVQFGMRVRRLTPLECERLQGFPDGFTLVPNGNRGMMADSQRYKMLGNSMAVPVMHWLGSRIAMVDAML